MMLERGDFVVIHEPFSSIIVQGYVVVNGEKLTDPRDLVRMLRQMAQDKPVFVKETTEYRYDLSDDADFLRMGTHTFIIRHPRSVIPSHYAMNPAVTQAEVGFEHVVELFENVRRASGYLPAIVQAERLATDPHLTIRQYCSQVGIPFIPSALHWRPGDREEWRRTSEWHRDVARSAGFFPRASRYEVRVDNDRKLAAYYDYHLPFYERLRSFAEMAAGRYDTAAAGCDPVSHPG
jgi:hypothetical protein